MKTLKTILLTAFLTFFGIQVMPSFASLSLTVMATDGTDSLRLGRTGSNLDNKKQMTVRISASGTQYQVFQRVLEPIVNERGEQLDLAAIETATIPGTNIAGTMYLQNIERLSMAEQMLYTSAPAGLSDSFNIAYAVRRDLIRTSGNFMGKLLYTLRPVGGGSEQTVIVNVTLENPANWAVNIENSRTTGRIMVKDIDTSLETADYVKIEFSGNFGKEVKIYQEVLQMPQDAMVNEIEKGLLLYMASGDDEANVYQRIPSRVGIGRVLIYQGQAQNAALAVSFTVDPDVVAKQNAGTYLGKFKYTVESDQGEQSFPMDIECQIQPKFTMDFELPVEGVKFNNILPNSPPVEKEVLLNVKSNLHKPYRVVQQLATPMMNEKGEEISKEYFTMRVEVLEDGKGKTSYVNDVPMETGDRAVYVSDSNGSPVSLRIIYKLQGYSQISGGSYSAPIRYSLNQD